MTYNFDEIVSRRGTNCVKWDETNDSDIIPLWVADMDFRTYPAITEALHKRVEHGVFGYTHVPQSYYECVIRWFMQRHQVLPYQPDEVIITIGVVPALSAIIRALTLPGDKVVAMTPVYNCFFSSIRNQGCQMEESHLIYENGTYQVDWDGFERRCADSRTRLFLLCNPHNPAGRVWTREELLRMHDICMRHNVFVVADEIHCEFVMPGHEHHSFASLCEEAQRNCALCVAASKAFNIAGLQTANILVADPQKRERIDRAINLHETCDVNPFGPVALVAAYTDPGSEAWLDALNHYIQGNYNLLCDFFAREFPAFTVTRLEGTYLAWLDVHRLLQPGLPDSVMPGLTGHLTDTLADRLLAEARVKLASGTLYGPRTGEGFLRLNLATQRARLAEALQRMQPVLAGFLRD